MEMECTLIDQDKQNEMIALVPAEKQEVARRVLKEIAFMADILEELRKTVREKGPTELFENGKQKMTRENPALKSYNNVVQRYSLLCKQYIDLLPKQQIDIIQTSLLDFLAEG